jgi:hypothetical protein
MAFPALSEFQLAIKKNHAFKRGDGQSDEPADEADPPRAFRKVHDPIDVIEVFFIGDEVESGQSPYHRDINRKGKEVRDRPDPEGTLAPMGLFINSIRHHRP